MRVPALLSRLLLTFVAGLLLVGAAVATPAAARGGYQPSFEQTGCDTAHFAGRLPAGMEIQCGLLTVKENRLNAFSMSNKVVLPVAIISSTAAKAKADPVVMLNGGPGGGVFEYFTVTDETGTVVGFADYVMALAESRDIIMMDQRGAGRAEPSTHCPEYSTLVTLQQLLSSPGDLAEEKALLHDNLRQCVETVRADGVDLNQYDTPNLARDLRDLRKALGIKKWNVYGHSYGGLLALELLRQEPWALRSVAMDAPVVPFEDNWSLSRFAAAWRNGFEAIAKTYGIVDVEARLEDLVAKFDTTPYAPTDTIAAGLVFTGEDVMHNLHSAMYVPVFMQPPQLDLWIPNLEAYGTADAFDFGALIGFPPGVAPTVFDVYAAFIPMVYSDNADGMVTAILCSGGARLAEEATLDQIRDAYGVYGIPRIDFPEISQVCDGLGIELDPWWTHLVRGTKVPTLIRHGSLDHAVPPGWSVKLAEKLGPHSQHLEFPFAGHALPDMVPADTLAEFISHPYKPVG